MSVSIGASSLACPSDCGRSLPREWRVIDRDHLSTRWERVTGAVVTQERTGRTKRYLIDLSWATKGESDMGFKVAGVGVDTARVKRGDSAILLKNTRRPLWLPVEDTNMQSRT